MKRTLIIGLAIIMVLSLVAGCSTGGQQQKQQGQGENNGTSNEVVIRYNMGTEPQTIDPALNSALDGAEVILHVFEGLTTLDENSKAKPGIAKSWEISDDGLTITFHLRDAKWSDGKPVTAGDFAYAWTRALDPKTASSYAYQLYFIKNAEKFNLGEASAEDLGVKVIDDKTLEVTLENPTPFIMELFAFMTYMPVRKDIIEAHPDDWTQNPETYIGDGAFKLAEWNHNDSIVLVKNENYWDAENIKPDKLVFTMISEAATELSAFESGDLDFGDNPPSTELERLKQEGVLKEYPLLSTYAYVFNTKRAPFDNPKVRKAFSLAIDRKAIVDQIAKGGQPLAAAWVPYGMPDAKPGEDFRKVGGDYFDPTKANVEEAKKLLAEAGYPDGKGLPEITLLYNTSESHKAIAEALQEMWKQNLGVDVKIANQEWQVFLATRRQTHDYQIARWGWVSDYIDPMGFLDMLQTGMGNNDAQYSNPQFDEMIRKSKTAKTSEERMQYLHKAEDILMDDAVVMPIYFYINYVVVDPKLQGYIVDPLGYVYFHHAYFAK